MKQIVILTSIDLCQERVNKFHTGEFNTIISKIFRIFVQGIARAAVAATVKVKVWATLSNIALAVACVASPVAFFSGLIAGETDSIESHLTLAISALVGISALGISMRKDGYFKPYDETEDEF